MVGDIFWELSSLPEGTASLPAFFQLFDEHCVCAIL